VKAFVLYLAFGIVAAGGQGSPQPRSPEKPVQSQLTATESSSLRAKAEGGDASAQFSLGKAYEEGNGVPQDDETAAKWYRKAADQHDAVAENHLGVMYRTGRGVDRDKEESVRWYHKAAKRGNPQALFNLGVSYYNGDGVPSDSTLAYCWFLLAQEAGNPAADDAVKRSAEEGGQKVTPEALLQIASMYEKGTDLPQSYADAAKWYRKAADQSPEAAVKLASMYIEDRGVLQDYGQAMTLCKSAAKIAYAPAQYCVGYLYRRGLGTQADPKEAAKWYDLAGQGGQRQALMELAEMYWKGEGVGVDRPQAYYYFFLAHRRGAPDAKTRAQVLWKEMSQGEITSLEKKLEKHYIPRDVFAYMQDLNAPEAPKGPGRR
jgi:TPR repeat protein